MRKSYYIGIMSGTSMDGVDLVLLDPPKQLLAAKTYPYPPWMKQILCTWSEKAAALHFFQLHRQLGEVFATMIHQFIEEYAINKTCIQALGCHGQTLIHAPYASVPYTVQGGCGHTIAALTNLTVITDFRSRDIALGGQGAPLAPLYHEILFASIPKPLAVLNIGGIANITFLNPSIKGYDVGPGNSLLDAWMMQQQGLPFDEAGRFAARGCVDPTLLADCLRDPYFSKNYPKSLDQQYFSLTWLMQHIKHKQISGESVQATLVELVAEAVKQALVHESEPIETLFVCGGGVHNHTLMQTLQRVLLPVVVQSTEAIGVSPDFVEAMMCAWLAQQTLERKTLLLHPITGGQTTVLGSVFFV